MQRSPQQKTAEESSHDSMSRLQDATTAKNVYFYKDGDTTVGALRVAVHPRRYRSMESLLSDLSKKIPGLSFGVRSIYTPGGHDVIRSIERLENEGKYVCSTYKNKARGVDILKVHPPLPWHMAKPNSGQRALNRLLKSDNNDETPPPQPPLRAKPFRLRPAKRRFVYAQSQGTDSSSSRTSNTPKRIVLIRNTEHSEKHVILLNRRTAQTFEQVLMDISGLFRMPVRRLFTLEGMRIHSLSAIFNGPEHYVVCGKERFRPFDEVYAEGQKQASLRHQGRKRGGPTVADHLREKRERLTRTRGRWRVWITTSEVPTAGCSAQVSITVYGEKGNSGPIPLGDADGETFQAGHVDEFENLNLKDKLTLKQGEISVGNIGFIYKIRIAHDNSTDYPGWFCEEVVMRDIHTDEELVFRCNRWLSRDEDDTEICRELPAVRPREPVLPVLKYQVTVVTGDYWSAGTEAHVYMTIYGDRGDTGVRQLYRSSNSLNAFQKGQSDTFQIEAVSLGSLRRVIIGHDGDGPGNGWYLDRVVIREDEKAYEECVFPCNRWLDEGEDDGKIVRELKIQDEYMHDQLEKEMWEYEKWKYGPDCQIMLFSKLTRKALRIRTDGQVDGMGEVENDEVILDVVMRKGTARMLKSAVNGKYLTINEHRVTSMVRHGPACELKLKVQPDRSVKLQSLKYNLQHVSVRRDGHVGDPRANASDPSVAFLAYCKGMFRVDGIIMLCTSLTQTVAIQHDNRLYGTGKRNRMAHFLVHKIDEGGIRMFESACFPDQYIRMKDGQCDCQGTGDQYCHFRVHRYREQGFITLESVVSRGLYVGLTPDGQIRPTVDTGEKNVRLYPEVLRFGRRKEGQPVGAPSPDLIPLSPPPPSPRKSRTPRRQKEIVVVQERDKSSSPERPRSRSSSPKRKKEKTKSPSPVHKENSHHEAGDWKVWIETAETAVDGEVVMCVYGTEGTSGNIVLGSTRNNDLFQTDRKDEFKVNLKSVGEIYKIRVELSPLDQGAIPTWLVREVRMQDLESKEVLKFKFNRWLSSLHDNLELVKELPAVRPKCEVLPVVNYLVETVTGEEPGSDTDAKVSLTLYGERGDTGKRLLNRGDVKAFDQGKTDVFEIEGVSLGPLTQCVVSVDGAGPGEGWFCKQLVVKETEDAQTEYVFLCNQWFDSSVDDKKTERILTVSEIRAVEEEAEKEEVTEDGDWRVWILTGKEEGMGLSGSVLLYAYGENYHIGPIIVGSGGEGLFQPGHLDEFKINLSPSMGEMYKIRVGHDELDVSGWYLEKLKMKNLVSKELLTFPVNRWMSRSQDDCDVWRELAAVRPGQAPLPVVIYAVEVYTGTQPGSDTEANVYMNIFGSRGDCGMRTLYKNLNSDSKFQPGAVDLFHVEAVHLGDLEKVQIGHDGEGAGAGWYLEKLVVRETGGADEEEPPIVWHFPCQSWFDEGLGDKATSREISHVKRGLYKLTIKTHENSSRPEKAAAVLTLYGTLGKTDDVILDNGDRNAFDPGKTSSFEVDGTDVGELYKIRLGIEESADWSEWRIDEVTLVEQATLCKTVYPADRILGLGEDRDLVQEIPINLQQTQTLPVRLYHVTVYSGDGQSENTDASIKLRLVGKRGDTGDRLLQVSEQRSRQEDGKQVDEFLIEAVDLTDVDKVVFSKSDGRPVYLSHVVVRSPDDENMEWFFPYNQYVGDDSGSSASVDVLLGEYRPVQRTETPVQDQPVQDEPTATVWTVTVVTSDEPSSAADGQVALVVCGRDGESEVFPLEINSQPVLQGGATDVFQIDAKKDLGPLFKLRIGWEDPKGDVSWKPEKITLENKSSSIEHVITPSVTLIGGESRDSWTEFPLDEEDWDSKKLEVLKYHVTVHTGDLYRAGTEARVHLNILGTRGTTGSRFLLQPLTSNQKPFQDGQTDEFIIEAVSVLDMRTVVIGHDGYGEGNGWYLEKVVIRESKDDLKMFVFNCQKWLDESEDDGELERELVLSDVQFEDKGDKWRAWGVAGPPSEAETLGRVLMVMYGDRGVSEERPLFVSVDESLSDQETETATFFMKEKVGELYKVRLQFEPDSPLDSQLFIQAVHVIDLESGIRARTFDFEGKKEMKVSSVQDGVIELPLQSKDQLSVYNYLVSVYTGKEGGAGVGAPVHLIIHGERGDTGRRKLLKSINNDAPFQEGQMDMFEVEAVDLGHVTKVTIGHEDGQEAWFLDKVMIKTKDSDEEFVFLADRWLSTDKEDGKTEIDIFPQNAQDHPWTLELSTGPEKEMGFLGQALLTVYGHKQASQPLPLGGENGFNFREGKTEQFPLDIKEDLGDVYKVRLGFDREMTGKCWFVEKLRLVNKESGKEYVFELNDWIRTGDSLDSWVEVAANTDDPDDKLDVINYLIEVHTGTDKDAGMTSQVYCHLIGSRGDSGRRKLLKEGGANVEYEAGGVETFKLPCVDLGDLYKLVIGFEDKNQSWYLEKVLVKEHPRDEEEVVFFSHRWLDVNQLDGKTEVELEPSRAGHYRVITRTGSEGNEDPSVVANVVLVIYSESRKSQPRPLGGTRKKPYHFKEGKEDVFNVATKMELGDIMKIRIGFDNPKREELSWHLENIQIVDEDNQETYLFDFDGWIRDTDDKESWTEIPVLKSDRNTMRQVLQYYVYVVTSDVTNAATDANVYITINGDCGDTGRRWLHDSLHKSDQHHDRFQVGQTDAFELSAVDLSNLTSVTLEHDGRGLGSGWHVDKVIIKMSEDDKDYYLFECGKWIEEDENNEARVDLPLTKYVQSDTDDEQPDPKLWKLHVYTGGLEDSGTNAQVSVIVFGDRGRTDVLPLGKPFSGYYEVGGSDEFNLTIDPDIVGTIRKIRIFHDNDNDQPGWYLDKLILENSVDRNQRVELSVERWLDVDQDDGDIVRELSVKWPDQPAWEEETYILEVHTGDKFGAGTDANVHVELKGEQSDSGKRLLKKNKRDKNKFESGEMDVFHVSAVGLGDLTELTVGHDGAGGGSGWYLEKINVKLEQNPEKSWEFMCDKWLDVDEDDGLIERSLLPTSAQPSE